MEKPPVYHGDVTHEERGSEEKLVSKEMGSQGDMTPKESENQRKVSSQDMMESQGDVTFEETGSEKEMTSREIGSQGDLTLKERENQGKVSDQDMMESQGDVTFEETESEKEMTPSEVGSQGDLTLKERENQGKVSDQDIMESQGDVALREKGCQRVGNLKDAGETGSEIIQMAAKLHELQNVSKVDMFKQFEQFLRNMNVARHSSTDSDYEKQGEKTVLVTGEGKERNSDITKESTNQSTNEIEHEGIDNDSKGIEGTVDVREGDQESRNNDLEEAEVVLSRKRQILPERGENVQNVKLQKFEKVVTGVEEESDEMITGALKKDGDLQNSKPEYSELEQNTSCREEKDIMGTSELRQNDVQHVSVDTTPPEVTVGEDGTETVTADSHHMVEATPSFPCTFSENPLLLTTAKEDFSKGNNFLKGCKWSPDGTCVLTNSEDGTLRLFNLPAELYNPTTWEPVADIKSVLNMVEGELVYDYCWYPGMTSLQPETCCFVSTCRSHPVHMWDAFDGQLRCSYRPHDHMDELITPYSLAFSLDGSKLYCGFNKLIKTFDINRPGKDCQTRQTKGKLGGQTGIISCFAMNPDNKMFAAGSYSKTIGLYSPSCPSAICVLHGQASGITELMYSSDGSKLYSAGRKDNQILCWDIRKMNQVLFCMNRDVTTNQRMYFDIDREDKFLLSGNQNGNVSVWDLSFELSPSRSDPYPVLNIFTQFCAHEDTTNGVSLHPSLPLLATASGQRKVQPPAIGSDGESDEETEDEQRGAESFHNSLKIWSLYENR